MSEYDNTNRGALFKNDDKTQENHPDYKGSINVNGLELWINAWLRVAKTGKKYMSLSVQPKQPAKAPPKVESKTDDFDDTIPFAFAFLAPAGLAVASAVYFFQPVVA